MKIGELQDRCGICEVIDYCIEPYETPHLCVYEELEDVDEETYKQIAESITEEEIKDKLRQYKENNVSPWTDNHNGAICDIVLEKLRKTDADIVMNIKDFCEACDNIESLENKGVPEVVLVEDYDDELFINGKSVCCHENLYPYDVLKALDDYGIINFRHKE